MKKKMWYIVYIESTRLHSVCVKANQKKSAVETVQDKIDAGEIHFGGDETRAVEATRDASCGGLGDSK